MSDDLTPDVEGAAAAGGMDRRTFVRRAAVTGALAWAAPSITSMPAAFAQTNGGSDICRLTIDEFEDVTTLSASGGATATTFTGASSGFILGGERDVELTVVGAQASFDIGGGAANPGQAVVLSGPNTGSIETKITWDGSDGGASSVGGFPPYDLTDGGSADRFLLDIGNIDANDTNQAVLFTLRVYSTAGNASVAKSEAPGAARTLNWAFSDFAGVDFTNVTAIQLQTNSGSQTDPFYFTLRVCYVN